MNKIINFLLVLLWISAVSFASEDPDFVLLENKGNLKKNEIVTPKNERPVTAEQRLYLLEKHAERQDELIKILTRENQQQANQIKLLEQTLGSMGGNRPVYPKVIPADTVLWISLWWAFLATYQIYNGNIVTATTVFFTTLVSIYWGLKETRNIASVIINKT